MISVMQNRQLKSSYREDDTMNEIDNGSFECKSNESMEEVKLDITVIMDSSGSMEEIQDDAIGSFNTFLADKKKLYTNSRMSIVLFDNEYIIHMKDMPIIEIQPLNRKSYRPKGSTALLDAIGRTINAIENREHVSEEILIAVLTDGRENSSKEYSLDLIKEMIQDRENIGWDFIYLSADPSAFNDARNMGFASSKIKYYKKMMISDAFDEMNREINEKRQKIRSTNGFVDQQTDQSDMMYQ